MSPRTAITFSAKTTNYNWKYPKQLFVTFISVGIDSVQRLDGGEHSELENNLGRQLLMSFKLGEFVINEVLVPFLCFQLFFSLMFPHNVKLLAPSFRFDLSGKSNTNIHTHSHRAQTENQSVLFDIDVSLFLFFRLLLELSSWWNLSVTYVESFRLPMLCNKKYATGTAI